MRLTGVLSGQVTAMDRPTWMGEPFTMHFAGYGEETLGVPGDSPWLNDHVDAPGVWLNLGAAVSAAWSNLAASSTAGWLNLS